MLAGNSLDVDRELETLARSLANELRERVPEQEVEQAIRQVREDFGDPPITQFLPILIERRVRARLAS